MLVSVMLANSELCTHMRVKSGSLTY